MLLLVSLLLLAVRVYALNAGENKKSEDVQVITTLEPGPDFNALHKKIP